MKNKCATESQCICLKSQNTGPAGTVAPTWSSELAQVQCLPDKEAAHCKWGKEEQLPPRSHANYRYYLSS